jgi:ABC-type transporter MlaC component
MDLLKLSTMFDFSSCLGHKSGSALIQHASHLIDKAFNDISTAQNECGQSTDEKCTAIRNAFKETQDAQVATKAALTAATGAAAGSADAAAASYHQPH